MAAITEHARYEREGPLAIITLDRPEAMNAVSPEMLAGIDLLLDQAEFDREIAAIAITGAGTAFCAGADLLHVEQALNGDTRAAMEFLREAHRVFGKIEKSTKPTIAAVNGLAVAAGIEIVLCCDLVIAAAGTRLGDAHANFGLLPGGGGSVRLPRRIGLSRAKELLFTGDFRPAEDLVACGLVNKVVPGEQLRNHVLALAEKMAAKSPLVLDRMKQLAAGAMDHPIDSCLNAELNMFEVHLESRDIREGLAAFKEKRKPVFIGH